MHPGGRRRWLGGFFGWHTAVPNSHNGNRSVYCTINTNSNISIYISCPIQIPSCSVYDKGEMLSVTGRMGKGLLLKCTTAQLLWVQFAVSADGISLAKICRGTHCHGRCLRWPGRAATAIKKQFTVNEKCYPIRTYGWLRFSWIEWDWSLWNKKEEIEIIVNYSLRRKVF